MLDAFLSFLKDPANRDVIAFVGGGIVVFVGGIWAVVKFFAKKEGGTPPAVRADRGGVAAGGNISNSTISTNSEKPRKTKS